MTSSVGIEAAAIAIPRRYLDLADLAQARGIDPAKYAAGLGVRRMTVADPGEDSVALGATAVRRLLDTTKVDPASVGLFIVGTETSVDHSKPVASHIQGLLELPSNMRVFDAKHACYGGTAGLMASLDWIRSGSARGRSAIVVCSDISRYGLQSAGEPTQGGGAIALLVSSNPRLLAIDAGLAGTASHAVYDFWRPHGRSEAVVDGKYSMTCYLTALAEGYGRWRDDAIAAGIVKDPGTGPGGGLASAELAGLAYHVPFSKMAHKAHAHVRRCDIARRDGRKLDTIAPTEDLDGAKASFDSQVAASLRLSEELGNCYTASLYLALASLLDARAADLAGKRVGLFSYGSGCTSEFFSGTVGQDAASAIAATGIDALLADRERIDVTEFERIMRQPLDAPDDLAPRPGTFRMRAIREHRRVYDFKPPA